MPAHEKGTKRISPGTNALALASHVDNSATNKLPAMVVSVVCVLWASTHSLIVGVGFGGLAGFAVDHPRRGLVSMPSCRSYDLLVPFEHRHLVGVLLGR